MNPFILFFKVVNILKQIQKELYAKAINFIFISCIYFNC